MSDWITYAVKSILVSFAILFRVYNNHQWKLSMSSLSLYFQSAKIILGFLNFITLPYNWKINKCLCVCFISYVIIIDFYITYNNLLSFQLLKCSKSLSDWGLHPQTPALVTQYHFQKFQKILVTPVVMQLITQ